MSLRDLTIRKFRTEDSKAVSKIISSSLLAENNDEAAATITPKFILALSNKRKMYVAVYENVIVGTASIEHDTIYTIYADVEYRGQGIEEAMLGLMEEIAANYGFKLIKLEGRVAEQKLYEKLGYIVSGEHTQSELGENVLMQKYI